MGTLTYQNYIRLRFSHWPGTRYGMLNRILYLAVTPESVKLQNNFQAQLLEKLPPLGLVTVHKQEQFYHFIILVTSSFKIF